MTFTVHEATKREEFDTIAEIQWAAFHEPFRPEHPFLYPEHDYTEEGRQKGLKSDADRRYQEFSNKTGSHWICATDSETQKVVGVMEWVIHLENPFPNGPQKLECTWFPEGEMRNFVTNIINQAYYMRMNWMDRPHLVMNAMAVLPEYRRRGFGSLIMNWGVRKAEELNLECFVEASDPGYHLYEKFGFQYLMSTVVSTHQKNPSQSWIRLQHMCSPITLHIMWRPKPSDVREGSTETFWDVLKRQGPRESRHIAPTANAA